MEAASKGESGKEGERERERATSACVCKWESDKSGGMENHQV